MNIFSNALTLTKMVSYLRMAEMLLVVVVSIITVTWGIALSYPRLSSSILGIYFAYRFGGLLIGWLSEFAVEVVVRCLSWLLSLALALWMYLTDVKFGKIQDAMGGLSVSAFTEVPYPYPVPYIRMPWYRLARQLTRWEIFSGKVAKAWAGGDFVYLIGLFVLATVLSLAAVWVLWWTLKLTIKLCRRIRTWWLFIRSRVYLDLGYVPFQEKMVPGSSFELNSPMPKIQCEVWVSFDKRPFQLAGQAWRYDNCLVTAWHNVSEADAVRLKSGEVTVDVPYGSGFENVEGDVAIYMPDVRDLNKLGLKTAKLAANSGFKTLAKVIAMGKMSMGFVEPYDAFGYVQYSGSTVPGFSGSPYLLSDRVVLGMHIGGMTVNVGYDVGYLKMLIRKMTKEASSDFTEFNTSGPVEIRRSAYDPDEYDVKVTNKKGHFEYLRMNEGDLFKWNKSWWQYRTDDYVRPYNAESDVFRTKRGTVIVPRPLRESKVVVEEDAQQVTNLQLQDQGNFLNPDAGVLASGNQSTPAADVPVQTPRNLSETEKLEDQGLTAMERQTSMPAVENDRLPTISELQQLVEALRKDQKERSQLLRLLCDLTNGDFVPEKKVKASTSGSKKSSKNV